MRYISLFYFSNLDSQRISASYMEHDALVYGGDWCLSPVASSQYKEATDASTDLDSSIVVERDNNIVGSCSFYKHSLHIWSF